MSGCANSIGMVKNKIRVLQEQATEATDRAERLQNQVAKERNVREEVCAPVLHLYRWGRRAGRFCVSQQECEVCC